MPDFTKEVVSAILHDMRNDAGLAMQHIDTLLMTSGDMTKLPYQELDMLHYIIRTMESRIKVLRGYDR
jgi:hypothetical protein